MVAPEFVPQVHRPQPTRRFQTGSVIVNPVNGGVVIGSGETEMSFRSHISTPGKNEKPKTWTFLSRFGIRCQMVGDPEIRDVQERGVAFSELVQNLRVELDDEAEWGCLQLRCVADSLTYSRNRYKSGQVLTVYFYRSVEAFESVPFPPLITLNAVVDQTVVPLAAGRVVQVIPPPDSVIVDLQEVGDRCLLFDSKERVGVNNRHLCHRYRCIRPPHRQQHMYVSGPNTTAAILLAPVFPTETGAGVLVVEPYRSTVIPCEDITSLVIRFARQIPKVTLPTNYLDVPRVNTKTNEMFVRFVFPLKSVTINHQKGHAQFSCVPR
jgi:hypothetical protein